MKKHMLVFGVLFILMISGCAQSSGNESVIDKPETREAQPEGTDDMPETTETTTQEPDLSEPESTVFEIDWDSVDTKHPDITLPDDFFLHYIDDIYANLEVYLNTVIAGQGYLLYLDENGEEFAFVRDYICCGPDAYPVGILCTYDGKLLENGTWVEIIGVIGKEKNQFTESPILHIVDMKKAKEGPNQRLVDY